MKKIKVRKRQGWKARHPGNYQWNKDINLVSHQAIYIGKGRRRVGKEPQNIPDRGISKCKNPEAKTRNV